MQKLMYFFLSTFKVRRSCQGKRLRKFAAKTDNERSNFRFPMDRNWAIKPRFCIITEVEIMWFARQRNQNTNATFHGFFSWEFWFLLWFSTWVLTINQFSMRQFMDHMPALIKFCHLGSYSRSINGKYTNWKPKVQTNATNRETA